MCNTSTPGPEESQEPGRGGRGMPLFRVAGMGLWFLCWGGNEFLLERDGEITRGAGRSAADPFTCGTDGSGRL